MLNFISSLIIITGVFISTVKNFEGIFNDWNLAKGLFYCISSSFLMSLYLVLQENTFESKSQLYDFLPWNGLFASIFCFVEGYIFNSFPQIFEKKENFGFVILMIFLVFILTSILPYFHRQSNQIMSSFIIFSGIWSILGYYIFSRGKYETESNFLFVGIALSLLGYLISVLVNISEFYDNLDVFAMDSGQTFQGKFSVIQKLPLNN